MIRTMLLSLLALTAPAFSAVINTYTDQSLWTAASTGVTTLDFNTSGQAGNFNYTVPGNLLALDGLMFSGVSSSLYVSDTSQASWANYGTGEALFGGYSTAATIRITLPTGITSFGLNLATAGSTTRGVKVSVGGATYTAPTFAVPTLGFFGATFDAPITTITLTAVDPSAYLFADNFGFGTVASSVGSTGGDPSPTPEISTLLMIGSGLVGLRTMRRRTRTASLAIS